MSHSLSVDVPIIGERQDMRTLLATVVSVAVLGVGLALSAQAEEPRRGDVSALPRTKQGLRDLDSRQLRIVRRASSLCNASGPRARGSMNPCIISQVESAVQSENDPALIAYNNALPFQARYDRFRSPRFMQRILINYAH